jgi:Domain of unknown function (DUF4123)
VDQTVLEWIEANLRGIPWGVFVLTKTTLETLVLHFQRFLMVVAPDGYRWFFRYYDPGILGSYLPTCNRDELIQFFGPVRGFAILDADENKTSVYQLSSNLQPGTGISSSGLWPIRHEQYAAFKQFAEKEFEKTVIAFLKEKLPESIKGLPPEVLLGRVRGGIVRARKHGINWQSSLTSFVALMFEMAANFDSHPLFVRLLNDRTPRNLIMKRMLDLATREEWQEIKAASDPEAWRNVERGVDAR